MVHFKAAFRRLISQCGGESTSGVTGNVSSQDDTELIQASLTTYVPPTVACQRTSNSLDVLSDRTLLPEDIAQLACHHGDLLGNIVVYISGWVVKKLLDKVKCDVCRCALVAPKLGRFDSKFAFLQLKNNKCLCYPSDGVVTVTMRVEQCLRMAGSKMTLLKVQVIVLSHEGSRDLFYLGDHITETASGLENHFFCLVRLAVQIYHDVRLHHIAKVFCFLDSEHMPRENFFSIISDIIILDFHFPEFCTVHLGAYQS